MQSIIFIFLMVIAICPAFLIKNSPVKLSRNRANFVFARSSPSVQLTRTHLQSMPICIDRTVITPLIQYEYNSYGFSLAVAAILICSVCHISASATTQGVSSDSMSFFQRASELILHLKHLSQNALLSQKIKWVSSSTGRDRLKLEKWNVCKLVNIERVSEEHIRYSFQFPFHVKSHLDLEIAQELVLCTVDAKGVPLKSNFFMASPPEFEDRFDIICRSGGDVSGRGNSPSILEFLSVGDELAVKGGRKRLAFPRGGKGRGKGDITALSILTSGLGILPTLQLLRQVLSDPKSSVQHVEVLWINDAKKDFILNEEIGGLEQLYGDTDGMTNGRLRVMRVVDREAGNGNTQLNDQLGRSMSSYNDGGAAMVLTEGAVATKAHQLYSMLGYPPECIATLV